jgi:hypothetical protein
MVERWLAATMLTTITLAAAGCGSGGSTPSSTTADATTPASFIAKADVICGRVNAEISSNPYRSPQGIARLAPQLSAYELAADAELGALTPPASLASDWKQIVTDAQKLARDTATFGAYAKANNLAAATKLDNADQPIHLQLLAIAKRDGFKVCSHPG